MTVRVLIVDDQAPFRMAARMVVDATDGFDVVGEAETGEDSVTMAAELQPDLVLMDVNLPGINGLDATRQILAEGAGAVVVLLLSTYEEDEYAPRAAECGAAAYIPKAVFGPDRLEDAWAAASAALRLALRLAFPAGHLPRTVVPAPGSLSIVSVPPIASMRSVMPCSPLPRTTVAGSKPDAVVAHAELERSVPLRERDRGAARVRVLRDVLQGFQAREVHGRFEVLVVASDAVGLDAHRRG